MILVLTAVGLLSGGFLASVGILTEERIALNKQQEIEEAITLVVPGTKSSENLFEEKGLTVYGVKGAEGNFLGYAIYSSGMGFQDKIIFMLGTNASLTRINGLYIIEQKETPGLGAKIADRKFFLQFWENKDCSISLSLHKPAISAPEDLAPSEINTITGATISSEAILDLANSSIERVRHLIKEGLLKSREKDGD
jgi:RnfABCDGE-type electron transport complex G subunit